MRFAEPIGHSLADLPPPPKDSAQETGFPVCKAGVEPLLCLPWHIEEYMKVYIKTDGKWHWALYPTHHSLKPLQNVSHPIY